MARTEGGDEPARESSTPASSLSDALLFTTLCIVGLPVDVLVKDGSVYSGVFHTACLQDGYGVVLKKARKIGKGMCDASLPTEAVIDTLVVLSADLAEIIVKDFLLPAEGIVGSAVDDGVEVAARDIESRACAGELEGEATIMRSHGVTSIGKIDQIEGKEPPSSPKTEDAKEVRKVLAKPLERDGSQENICPEKVEEPFLMPIVSVRDRQVTECRGQGKGDCNHIDEMVHEGRCLSASYGVGCGSLATAPAPAWKGATESESLACTSSSSSYANSSAISTSSTSVSDNKASLYLSQSESTILSAPKKNTLGTTSAKESKLNPSAKVFSPSFANFRSTSTTGTPVVIPVYTPASLPAMPIAGVPSGIEISPFASRSSMPSKFVPYNSLVAGHSGIGAQYPRPVMGHASARQQPARFGAQNHPVQAGPPYVNPNPQTVMVGRMGQFVYVDPITQDPIQGPQVISQGFPHSLLTPYQANMPKLQGTAAPPLQLCMAPPLIAASNQPLMVPSSIPFTQPFPAIRPIMVPSGNGIFASRFQ